MPGGVLEKKDDFILSEEISEWIGLKKSEYLSKLIQNQAMDDIGIEEFSNYNYLIEETIQKPDKRLELIEDKQTLRTYIKTYQQKSLFHQVVTGLVVQDHKDFSEVFVPILTFVTRDDNLVRLFSLGKVINPPILN